MVREPGDPPVSVSLLYTGLELQMHSTMPSFHLDVEDPTSGPYVYVADTLPADPSPQSQRWELLMIPFILKAILEYWTIFCSY